MFYDCITKLEPNSYWIGGELNKPFKRVNEAGALTKRLQNGKNGFGMKYKLLRKAKVSLVIASENKSNDVIRCELIGIKKDTMLSRV